MQEGSGVENYDDGSWYKGRWEKGKYTLGVYKSNSGERYAGEFEDGQRSGNGVVTETNGSVFSGQWSKGSPSGYGELKGGTDDSFAMVLGQFNDNSDSRVVVRNKNGEEWIKVEKHSKAEGPCVQMDSSDAPLSPVSVSTSSSTRRSGGRIRTICRTPSSAIIGVPAKASASLWRRRRPA